jgi:hypothetical protein
VFVTAQPISSRRRRPHLPPRRRHRRNLRHLLTLHFRRTLAHHQPNPRLRLPLRLELHLLHHHHRRRLAHPNHRRHRLPHLLPLEYRLYLTLQARA